MSASTKTVSPAEEAAGQAASPVVSPETEAELKAPAMNKKELIDEVVLRSGVKRTEAKPVVDALLAILGETVASGRDLNLRPFGKLHLNRTKVRNNGTVHICRLRQPLAGGGAGQETDAAE